MDNKGLLLHPYLKSMAAKYRRPLHLSAPLPPGLNPFWNGVTMQLALAHGELRSIKELVAYSIIVEKLETGELYPGVTTIDASSGNTGQAYAGILQPLGIQLRLIVQGTMPAGKLNKLRFYGEGIEIVSHMSATESTVERARREAKEFGYVLLDQYANEKNPEAHEKYTGPALLELTSGELDIIVVPAGTMGTALGLARFFNRRRYGARDVRIVAVVIDPDTKGGKIPQIPGMRTCADIRRNVKFKWEGTFDEVRLTTRSDAVLGARRLAYAEPSHPGLSTGAAYMAALEYAKDNLNHLRRKRMIILSPDSIDPYLDIMLAEQDDEDIAQALARRPAF